MLGLLLWCEYDGHVRLVVRQEAPAMFTVLDLDDGKVFRQDFCHGYKVLP